MEEIHMKVYAFALVAAFSLAACTHSADLTPKISAGDKKVSTTGGACPADVVADSTKQDAACAGDDLIKCSDAAESFARKHPNIKCTITRSSGITFIDTTANAVATAPTPVTVTATAEPANKCPQDLVGNYQGVVNSCGDLDQGSSAQSWKACEAVCRSYLNSFDTESCQSSSGVTISRSTVNEYADQADFNRFMHNPDDF
jgi:hypothetical protein